MTNDEKRQTVTRHPSVIPIEVIAGFIAAVAAVFMLWFILSNEESLIIVVLTGLVFALCLVVLLMLLLDPEPVRARQTDSMLQLSSSLVDLMSEGLDNEAANGICAKLLPNTSAIAVAITDRETILGYVGYLEAENPSGRAIRTQATRDTIEDGNIRVLYTAEEIGLPTNATMIQAAIIVPLRVGHEVRGTLKFYYRKAKQITETQRSIAQGFGSLISTELAAIELEEQRELTTVMELKMLQNQINPHFLFNTINTIASLIRTDPQKARELLREFAVFYRSTLENSQDLIEFSREVAQTQRYFMFEVARFGEDRLELEVDLWSDDALDDFPVEEIRVPPFLLQPLVENSVKHAMPAEGKLTVYITASADGQDLLVKVADDGVGMTEETRQNILHPESQTGLGIAVKNVHDRMCGYYGPDAEMCVESKLGEGTAVTLRFPNILIKESD